MTLKFVQYSPIINSYKGNFVDKIKLEFPEHINKPMWTVTEKIQGAAYSFWTDGTWMQAGNRKGFIDTKDPFYNHEEVFDKYYKAIAYMRGDLLNDIVVYGELFGGNYQGETEGTVVSKEIEYAPHNEFMIFDIAVITRNDGLRFLPYAEIAALGYEYEVPVVPLLAYGTLDEALAFNPEFDSFVPQVLGLDPLINNLAEGVVIKPNEDLYTSAGERVILKHKNDKFKEKSRHKKRTEVPSNVTAKVLEVLHKVAENLTKPRLDSAISKVGTEVPFAVLAKEFYEDALSDDVPEYKSLSAIEQKIVNKQADKIYAPMIKQALGLK